MKKVLGVMTCVALGAFGHAAYAEAPFSLSTTIYNAGVAPQTVSTSLDSITSTLNYFETTNLQAYVSQYNDNSGVLAQVDYMGTKGTFSFGLNSTAVTVNIPAIGLDKTFAGTSRDDSVSQMTSYLTGNGGAMLNQIQQALAAQSPISPLAGNPNSLQSTMVSNGFTSTAMNTSANASPTATTGAKFGISASAGQFSSGGFSGQSITVPIAFAYRFTKSGWELQISLPLTYQTIDGAKTYGAQGGVALQIPVYQGIDWYITPMASAGATASVDLGAAGASYSYSLASRYTYHATQSLALTMGNMVGYDSSLGLSIDGYNIDPAIKDTVTKNGLMAEYETPLVFLGQPLSIRAGGAETDFFGTKLYMNSYTDAFADFGAITTGNGQFYQRIRIGVRGTYGKRYSSLSFGLGYTF